MLAKIAVTLLIVWLLGLAGLYRGGELIHVFLLAGLLLLLLAFAKARDAASQRGNHDTKPGDRGRRI